MNLSIIHRGKTNIYSSTKELLILSYFLTDDIGGRKLDSLIDWLNNDEYKSAVLNHSFIKKNQNQVFIYAFYDGFEREENKDRDKFVTEKNKLIEIAKKWYELYSKYIYIKITEESGTINLIGTHEKI